LANVFIAVDLSALSLISALVVGLLVPCIYIMWFVGFMLSRWKDDVDRNFIHLGTFVGFF
jgi:hypothetical protein